jgi:hypothetical protein
LATTSTLVHGGPSAPPIHSGSRAPPVHCPVDTVYDFINTKTIQFPLNSERFKPRPSTLYKIQV